MTGWRAAVLLVLAGSAGAACPSDETHYRPYRSSATSTLLGIVTRTLTNAARAVAVREGGDTFGTPANGAKARGRGLRLAGCPLVSMVSTALPWSSLARNFATGPTV
jgi:hypothetical protein